MSEIHCQVFFFDRSTVWFFIGFLRERVAPTGAPQSHFGGGTRSKGFPPRVSDRTRPKLYYGQFISLFFILWFLALKR